MAIHIPNMGMFARTWSYESRKVPGLRTPGAGASSEWPTSDLTWGWRGPMAYTTPFLWWLWKCIHVFFLHYGFCWIWVLQFLMCERSYLHPIMIYWCRRKGYGYMAIWCYMFLWFYMGEFFSGKILSSCPRQKSLHPCLHGLPSRAAVLRIGALQLYQREVI